LMVTLFCHTLTKTGGFRGQWYSQSSTHKGWLNYQDCGLGKALFWRLDLMPLACRRGGLGVFDSFYLLWRLRGQRFAFRFQDQHGVVGLAQELPLFLKLSRLIKDGHERTVIKAYRLALRIVS
jgi:hypothetical protein